MNTKEVLNLASNGAVHRNSASVRRGIVRLNRGTTRSSDTNNQTPIGRDPNVMPEGVFYNWLFNQTFGGLDEKEEKEVNSVISNVLKYMLASEDSEAKKAAYYFYVTLFANGDVKALDVALSAGVLPDGEEVIFYGFSCERFCMLRKISSHPLVKALAWWPETCIRLIEQMEEQINEEMDILNEPLSDFYEGEYWRLYEQLMNTLASTSPRGQKWSTVNEVSVVDMIRDIEERWKMQLPTYDENVEALRFMATCGDLVGVWKFIRDNWGNQRIYPDVALDAACINGQIRVFTFLYKTLGVRPKVNLEGTMLKTLENGHKEIFIKLHGDPETRSHLQWESIWKSLLRACVYIGDWYIFEELMKWNEEFISHENKDYFVDLAVWHIECKKFEHFIHFATCPQLVRNVEAWWGKAFRVVVNRLLSRKWNSTRKKLVENVLIRVFRENRQNALWKGWEGDYKSMMKNALKYKHCTLIEKLLKYQEFAQKTGWKKIYRSMFTKLEKKKFLRERWAEVTANAKREKEELRKFIAERGTNAN